MEFDTCEGCGRRITRPHEEAAWLDTKGGWKQCPGGGGDHHPVAKPAQVAQ